VHPLCEEWRSFTAIPDHSTTAIPLNGDPSQRGKGLPLLSIMAFLLSWLSALTRNETFLCASGADLVESLFGEESIVVAFVGLLLFGGLHGSVE